MNTDHRYNRDTNSSNMANVGNVEDGYAHMATDKSLQLRKSKLKALKNVFGCLRELGSDEERIRITAGVNLLRHLYRKQKECEDEPLCSELSYALKRLVCGVCSRHIPKRAGYFSVLVETLQLFDVIIVQDVMEIIKREFEDDEGLSRKVSTESYIGSLFAIGALIRAGTFLSASSEKQAEIVEKLVCIGRIKDSFLPAVYSFLVDLMKKIDDKKFKEVVWLHLKPELSKSLEKHTVNSLYVLLEAQDRFPSVVKKKFLLRNLGRKEILDDEFICYCSKLLMDAPVNILNSHPLYEILIPKVVSSQWLRIFWESLVQEAEKEPTPNREKALINSIVKLVPLIDKNQIPELLNDGFMDLIIKIFQNRKNNTELISDICGLLMSVTSILNSAEVNEEIKLSFIKRLMLFPGPFTFDAFDGTKIAVQLWPSMSVIGMEEIGSILKNMILAIKPKVKNLEGETCPWTRRERSYAIKLFSKLLSITVQEDKLKWKIKELKFLLSQGFISTSKSNNVVLDIASEVRNSFFKVFDPALSPETQSIKVLSSVVDYINNLIFAKGNSSKWYQHLSESSLAAWKKMFELVKNLQSVKNAETGSKKSGKELFIILFLHMGLQLLRDATLAEEALQELHSCYERTEDKATNRRKKRRSIENGGEDEPHWVEVMVDLFLSLLSHNSALHRNIVGSVFPHLCPYLTATSVHQLLEVLDPNAGKKLFHDDSEDESTEESTEESEVANENPSKLSTDDKNEDDDYDDEDEDDDDDDDDLEGDDEPVNDLLKVAVQNALKKAMNNGKDSDEESIDMDQMTKEERNRLDAALSEAFKLVKYAQGSKKNKKQSKDDETLMNFRIRVLDLIFLYLSKKPDLGLVLDIILPLFDLLEFCIKDNHQVPLEKRVRSCLMKLCNVKQFSSVNGVNEKVISEVLAKLMHKGQRVAAVYQIMKTPLCKCSSFLVRTSLNVIDQESNKDRSKPSPILDVYKEALVSFFTNRDSLLPVEVFGNVLVISWKGAWALADDILKHAFTSECRPFRRSQALQLLNKFFCNRRVFIDASKNDTKALHKMEKSLLKKTVEVLLNVVNGKQSEHFVVKERNIEELLGLLLTIHKINHQNKEREPIAVHWEDVKEAILQYWQSQTFGNVIKSNIRKLASELNIELAEKTNSTDTVPNKQNGAVGDVEIENISKQVAVENEESLDSSEDNGDKGYESGNGINDENDNEEEQPIRKRKRSKSDEQKNRNIRKKQAKYARLSAMSDGLEGSCNFTQVNLKIESPEREVEVPDRRKRKKSGRKGGKHGENNQESEEDGQNQESEGDDGESEILEGDGGESEISDGGGGESEKSEDDGGKRKKGRKTIGEVNGMKAFVSKYDKKFQHKMKRKKEKKRSTEENIHMKRKEEEGQCI